MYWRGEEPAQREVKHWEEGGPATVHAEQASVRPVRNAAGRSHVSGELDWRIRVPRISEVSESLLIAYTISLPIPAKNKLNTVLTHKGGIR